MCVWIIDRFYMCVCGSEKLAGSMCVHVFGSLFGIVVEFDKKKKKSLLERNDKGQGKIFDRFFFLKKNLVGCLE